MLYLDFLYKADADLSNFIDLNNTKIIQWKFKNYHNMLY